MLIEIIIILVLMLFTGLFFLFTRKNRVVESDYCLCSDKCRESVNNLINYLKTRKSKLSTSSKTEVLYMWCDIITSANYKFSRSKIDENDSHSISEHRKIVIEALKNSFIYDNKLQDFILVPEQVEIVSAHIIYLIII